MGSLNCCEYSQRNGSLEFDIQAEKMKKNNMKQLYPVGASIQDDVINNFESQKEMLVNSNEITIDDLKTLYDTHKGQNKEGKCKIGEKGGSYFLYFDCQQKWVNGFLDSLSDQYCLPKEINGVAIGYLDEDNIHVNSFMQKCINHPLSFLWLNYIALDKYEVQYRLNVSKYLPTVMSVIPKVTEWLALNYCKLDSGQLSRLFQAASAPHDSTLTVPLQKFDFDNSSLNINGPIDFGKGIFCIN